MKEREHKYLERMAELYPSIAKASTEVINLQSILNLPKGTEHFLTDIHGEYEAFAHVLKNGSGSVKRKIDDVFGNTLSAADKSALATLIYYPREKMALLEQTEMDMGDWYKITLYRLIEVSKRAASKYTRSKVRKALPVDFAYVIEELITEKAEITDKESYYNEIVNTIIQIGRAPEFITALSELIQRLVIDHLHIVGDIYDRGPGPHIIMDMLMQYHSVDIQWGNHDVLWMGAAAGQWGCIANVVRICARYANLDLLEDSYGINLLPLASFASRTYGEDACVCFTPRTKMAIDSHEQDLNCKMHKAIAVIQFKVEGNLIKSHPEFEMESRLLLDKMNSPEGTILIDGKTYAMRDHYFPTVDPADPYRLTSEEQDIMERLERGFLRCEKLQKHIRFLLTKGSLYKVYNGNLLYHGCIPLYADGTFKPVTVYGKTYQGKALYDVLDSYIRKAFFALDEKEQKQGKDLMWFIWLHENSPLFGKNKMATFERYFLEDQKTHEEKKTPYYNLLEQEDVVKRILKEFGLSSEQGHIINGHVPVKTIRGESPVKCGGKVLVIDGGFSRAYQAETGIAGYTLVYNSYGMRLVAHEPFESTEEAIQNEKDIHSESMIVETATKRYLVGDTDIGKEIRERITDLEQLIRAYRAGLLVEKI